MRRRGIEFLILALVLALLWGCGSNRSSDGDIAGGGGAEDAEFVGSSTCKVCHTAIAVDEGFNGSVHDDDAVAGCEGCHGGGQFHQGVGPIPYPVPGPAQCTECHTLSALAPVPHTDDPATPTVIEGVVVNEDDINGCQVCHYTDHNPVLTINSEWSESGHGGHLATGPVTSATADAWVHYNWDDTSSRGSCQRCHTATGISNFLNDPAAYATNGSGNDFSYLADWSAAGGSGQQEVLYCWGCHSDVSEAVVGAPMLRNPGAITETYDPLVVVSYPDVGPSNICMGCHIGRETGEVIKVDTDPDGVRSFINSHYLTAGGTLFNESGYEYEGQIYDDFGFHKNIGVGDPATNFNTGSSGPCAGCHMSVDEGHTFEFLTKTADGNIEDNESPLCTNCHATMDGDTVQSTKDTFHEALEELNVALQARGMFFFNSYPYFFTAPGGTGGSFTDWNSVAEVLGVGLSTDPTGTGWKNVMGAAFNYNLLEHDPGSYAHNSDYALKLIADSIDFLDDGEVNDSADSLASTLIGKGMNISGGAGYSPIHDTPVEIASAAPTTSQATCSVCHPAAPHYGGYPTPDASARPQWVNNQVVTCAECHGAHPSLNQMVITQYAESNHGDVTGGAWVARRAGGCGRCHTTTGYINDLVSGTTFSFGADDPSQTLNCNGCHTSIGDGSAVMRAAPAYTANWNRNSVVAEMTFPDAGDSNLCVRCHSARRAGVNITPLATTTAHYLPAATVVFGGTANSVVVTANTLTPPNDVPAVGTMFTGGGYEFAGQSYAGLGPHKMVGGTSGPCVGCHMSGTAGHTWEPVSKNEATGEITAINSGACNTALCHNGSMTPAVLNTERAEVAAALDVLEAQLNSRSIFFDADEGDFFQDAGFTTGVNNAYYATQAALPPAVSTRDLQGAAYNLWLFRYHGGDPAGYVHNEEYAIKLITDSADLLNDGVIDGDF